MIDLMLERARLFDLLDRRKITQEEFRKRMRKVWKASRAEYLDAETLPEHKQSQKERPV